MRVQAEERFEPGDAAAGDHDVHAWTVTGGRLHVRGYGGGARTGRGRGGARAHRGGRRRDRADGQRRAGRADRRARGASRAASTACASTRCTRCTRARRSTGACGDHLRHVSYFLSPVTRPAYWAGALRPRAEPLLRDAAPAADRDEVLARARGGEPARPARLLQPRHQRRVRRGADRQGAVLRRGQPAACRARRASTRSTPRSCSAGASATRRSSRSRRRCRTSATARSPQQIVERIPDGATLQVGIGGDPERGARVARAATATSASTPSCCPTASSTWSSAASSRARARRCARTRSSRRSRSAPPRLYEWLHENQRGRAAARRLRQQPAHGRARARLRLDQRDDGGRPVRPVRVGDDGRALLVLERRAGRLRARRDVLRGRPGVHRAALDDAQRDQPDPRRA